LRPPHWSRKAGVKRVAVGVTVADEVGVELGVRVEVGVAVEVSRGVGEIVGVAVGSTMLIVSVRSAAPRTAWITAVPAWRIVISNSADSSPIGTVTEAGTDTTRGSSVVSVTTIPPADAGWSRATLAVTGEIRGRTTKGSVIEMETRAGTEPGVFDRVGVEVAVRVLEAVAVQVEVEVGVWLIVAVKLAVRVAVQLDVDEKVGVLEAVALGEEVRVGEGEKVAVRVAGRVGVGEAVGVGVVVSEGVEVPGRVWVLVEVAVRVGLPPGEEGPLWPGQPMRRDRETARSPRKAVRRNRTFFCKLENLF